MADMDGRGMVGAGEYWNRVDVLMDVVEHYRAEVEMWRRMWRDANGRAIDLADELEALSGGGGEPGEGA